MLSIKEMAELFKFGHFFLLFFELSPVQENNSKYQTTFYC